MDVVWIVLGILFIIYWICDRRTDEADCIGHYCLVFFYKSGVI